MKNRQDDSTITPLVRWEFERGHRHLSCAIRATPASSSFEVATVSHWDGGEAAVEIFDRPSEAFQRHATIATDLRSAGWTVAAYTV